MLNVLFSVTSICLDACLVYAIVETMLAQLLATGDVNIVSFARHVASRHGLTLSDEQMLIFVHDLLAEGVERGRLHSILHANATISSNGSLHQPC